ncbi:Apolipoprotein N-acyltransferase [Limihaloglobus sulfuriphilus]|uniref:Apolipoprotein N-acyltransferase n=1 Tax=Limihaloglobus sulfuriphilus TaxID=1851148 RepID=A0A1Q2MFY2_9BACT|nr:apolipoprotein N-acyltransferase [Limihaloglobus sulfuriphilus]AQQ71564.1 Apolipoprotein N-acyltransferase [Limihaloglobus sulfuriphilus]
MKLCGLNHKLFMTGLLLISAMMLSLMQAPFNMSFLAWVCLVPFALAVCFSGTGKTIYLLSFLVYWLFWIANLYWVKYVTVPGWIASSAICAIYWPAGVFFLRWSQRKRIPLFVSLTVTAAGLEAWKGVLFNGFDWHLLAHSQYSNLEIIQFADITGAAGVSVLIALVNGVLAQLIMRQMISPMQRKEECSSCGIPRRPNLFSNILGVFLAAAALASALYYGNIRLEDVRQNTEQGPKIGIVQTNYISLVNGSNISEYEMMDRLLELSRECAEAGAKFIVWPETVVPGILNEDYLMHCPEYSSSRIFDRKIRDFAAQYQCFVLAGASAATVEEINGEPEVVENFNSAFLYLDDGSKFARRFDKIHLVPFGEYIPFREYEPLMKALRHFIPYDFDYSLDAGDSLMRFPVQLEGKAWGFAVSICYEDTDAQLCRRLAYPDGETKVDWLLNISNDGWYIRQQGTKLAGSTEAPQRTAISVFRAIENRIAIPRSVNTGLSCFIGPDGTVIDGFEAGTLPQDAWQRHIVEGWFIDRVPLCRIETVFSKQGDIVNDGFGYLFTGLFFLSAIERFTFRRKKDYKNEENKIDNTD